jgi:glycosyltransferase involved in cell wall biosynthesis
MSSVKGDYLVSALVSAYNSEKFIRGCLEDLKAQSFAGKLEIIVIDSGSEQNEAAVVRELQQTFPSIVYIHTQERETLYAAWNRGIRAARGAYLTSANTDDRHRADALEIMSGALEDHPEADLVYADCYATSVPNEPFDRNDHAVRYRYPDYFPPLALLHFLFSPQPVWRKEVHARIGYFDESYHASGDYEFNLRFALNGLKALHLAEPLGLYLTHPGAISSTARMAEENRRISSLYMTFENIERAYRAAGCPSGSHKEKSSVMTDFGTRALEYYPPWNRGRKEINAALALQSLAKAVEIDPGNIAALNNMAVAVYSTGDRRMALQVLEHACAVAVCDTVLHNVHVLKSGEGGLALMDPGLGLPSQKELYRIPDTIGVSTPPQ